MACLKTCCDSRLQLHRCCLSHCQCMSVTKQGSVKTHDWHSFIRGKVAASNADEFLQCRRWQMGMSKICKDECHTLAHLFLRVKRVKVQEQLQAARFFFRAREMFTLQCLLSWPFSSIEDIDFQLCARPSPMQNKEHHNAHKNLFHNNETTAMNLRK